MNLKIWSFLLLLLPLLLLLLLFFFFFCLLTGMLHCWSETKAPNEKVGHEFN